ncbi:TetR/AcrR family transcriptional regulator [Sulfurovum sp.]|uniref:TetR/AcrR family transcriptional regulator n=1 Tax=Sulfurovum sp. TaxID=1969726 RepID=UPI0025F2376C|nr:TetR/AcrR family transcriptional regulator [Sulfurovum sp.]
MAIIVNKEEKRRNIALSCRELLLEHGIDNLTIAQIAKTAGVGKGTVYEYFENKEDIVFEIITTFITEHEKRLEEISRADIPTKEKLFHFFYLLFENETAKKHLNIYKEFLAISLMHETRAMLEFSEGCRVKFMMLLDRILKAGIASGELNKQMQISASSLILFGTGLIVDSRLSTCDVKKEIELFLNILFGTEENR